MKYLITFIICLLVFSANVNAQCAGATDDRIWMIDEHNNLLVVNPTANTTRTIGNTGQSLYDIAYHPSGNLFGVRSNGDLYRIDTSTATLSYVMKLTGLGNPNAMICDGDGDCYVASQDDIVVVDVIAGTFTDLVRNGDFQSMGDFLFKDGVLYLAAENDDNHHADRGAPSLYEIDIHAGQANLIDKFSMNVDVYGLANKADGTTYAVATNTVYELDVTTAVLSSRMLYTGGTAYGLTSTGDFCQSEAWLLPVEMTYFDATVVNSEVQLNWETATEKNADYFSIERSFDGQRFETIGREQAAGTTTAAQVYFTTDKPNFAGTVYYRLKQVDFDGKHIYSEIKAVSVTALPTATVMIYPNPTNGEVKVSFDGGAPQQVNVFSLNGQLMMNQQVDAKASGIQMNLTDLPAGIYFMEMEINGQRVLEKVVLR